ncbi:hypothetical protein BU26DRAFT_512911, partial [Trematosphaeria pertusa]
MDCQKSRSIVIFVALIDQARTGTGDGTAKQASWPALGLCFPVISKAQMSSRICCKRQTPATVHVQAREIRHTYPHDRSLKCITNKHKTKYFTRRRVLLWKPAAESPL